MEESLRQAENPARFLEILGGIPRGTSPEDRKIQVAAVKALRRGADRFANLSPSTQEIREAKSLMPDVPSSALMIGALAENPRTAEAFLIEEIVDPRDTRPLLCEFANLAAPIRQPGPTARAINSVL